MRALNLKECSSRHHGARLPNQGGLRCVRLDPMLALRAGEGMTDWYQGQEAFIRALYQFLKERARELKLPFDTYMAQKVAPKGRQFNTILNNPGPEEERKALEEKRQAEPYRKASDRE